MAWVSSSLKSRLGSLRPDLQGGVVEVRGIEIGGESKACFLASTGLVQPGLFQEPILVTGVFPPGEIHDVEAFTSLAEILEDSGVSDAILDQKVDFVAEVFGWTFAQNRGCLQERA